MDDGSSTIFTDFLSCLGVRHTDNFSNRQFGTMPFNTMFGLKKLLETYGVDSGGISR